MLMVEALSETLVPPDLCKGRHFNVALSLNVCVFFNVVMALALLGQGSIVTVLLMILAKHMLVTSHRAT